MRNIIIKSSRIQFKNPQVGRVSRAVEDHYFGRNVTATIDGEEELYRFKPHEIPFDANEDDMIAAVERKVQEEDSRNEGAE